MIKSVISLLFLFFVFGCGDAHAPFGAIVTGPENGTETVSGPAGGFLYRALDFRVVDQNSTPLSGVEVEGLTTGAGVLVDENGLSLSRPDYLKTETDDRGIIRFNVGVSYPACTTDVQTVTGGIGVTVGSGNTVWGTTITVEAC